MRNLNLPRDYKEIPNVIPQFVSISLNYDQWLTQKGNAVVSWNNTTGIYLMREPTAYKIDINSYMNIEW